MKTTTSIVLTFLILATQVQALVVSDPGAYTRLIQQIQEAQKIYTEVKKQVQEVQRVYKNLEGNLKRGVGSLRDIRRIKGNIERLIPSLYRLSLPDGTEIDPSLSEDIGKAIDQIFISPTANPKEAELTEEQQRVYRQRALKSSLSFSESMLADVNKSLEQFESLAAQIDETEKLKDAQDLTNRYLQEILTGQTKVIMLLAQLARAEAALNYQGVENNEQGKVKAFTSEQYLDQLGKYGSKYWKAKPEAESIMHELMGISP
tara:strand:- start:23741 stop:24523 length:783 start_codon:yes stop_codon:yes gene_type:complete